MGRPGYAATIVRVAVRVAYFAALGVLAWSTGHPADGGDDETGLEGWQVVLSFALLGA
jgi:hypothetical protein